MMCERVMASDHGLTIHKPRRLLAAYHISAYQSVLFQGVAQKTATRLWPSRPSSERVDAEATCRSD